MPGGASKLNSISLDSLYLFISTSFPYISYNVICISLCFFAKSMVTFPNVGIVDNGQPMIINVYPNPTLGNVTIDLAKQQSEVQITLYDMYGKLVYLNKYQDSKLIELSLDAPPGIYYLDINSGKISSRHKIIMQ